VPSAQPPATLPAALPAAGWRHDFLRLMRRHFALKVVGITGFMWLFFVGYFALLRHPAFPVLQMPLTVVDAWVPFQPAALPLYLSLWVYVGIPPGLLPGLRPLVVYGLWAAALCVAGLGCFYFWPTAVPPPSVDLARHPSFALLKGVDAAGNACPSMHVAAAMFTMLQLQALLGRLRWPAPLGWLNIAWFAAIAYSTLAVKQHVLFDVIAGALLGFLFALPALLTPARRTAGL